MNKSCRLYLLFILTSTLIGCSSIHNSIGPDKKQSELQELVNAPLELITGESPFCAKPEVEMAAPVVHKLVKAPEPYNAKLYFLLDQTNFTPESEIESKKVYQTILERKSSEIVIIGHTDTAASTAYNDALSQRRAERVQRDLIDLGVAAEVIKISSEGEYRLLVSTPDETVEVRNRRVEINAR